MRKSPVQPLRRGSVAVLAAFFLVMIFAFAAFSIDAGYITIVRQELSSGVDAAALSAAQELRIAPTDGAGPIKNAAVDVAAENVVNGQPLVLDRQQDVEVGVWDPDLGAFVAVAESELSKANAVRVTGRLSEKRSSAVPLFFAPVISRKNLEMQESAIAVYGRGKPRDVVLVIDCSGSMSSYNRMTYTRPAALSLIDELGDFDRLSLVVYSYPIQLPQTALHDPDKPLFARFSPPTGELVLKPAKKKGGNKGGNNGGNNGGGGTRLTGYLEQPLDLSFESVRERIPELVPGLYSSRTNIAGGLRVAIEELLDNSRTDFAADDYEKVIVLMTDGHANEIEPPGVNPVDSIYYYSSLAEDNDIIIHGITLGFGADELPIRDAAETTGGEYYYVPDGDDIKLFEVYRSIGRGTGARLVR